MLTIFGEIERRYRTENGGVRFFVRPMAIQVASDRPEQRRPVSEADLNLNLVFEDRSPEAGFRDNYRDVPDFGERALTHFVPQGLSSVIVKTRFDTKLSSNELADLERCFDNQSLSLSVSWADSRSLDFADFVDWFSGGEVGRPKNFWLSSPPDIALVRKVQ